MSTITKRLRDKGHTVTGDLCEKCWDDAYLRSIEDPSRSQYEHYGDITIEAEAATDEEASHDR